MTRDILDKFRQKILLALYETYRTGVEGVLLTELLPYVRFKALFDDGMKPQEGQKAIWFIRAIQGDLEEEFTDPTFTALEVLQSEKLLVSDDEGGVIFITHDGINQAIQWSKVK